MRSRPPSPATWTASSRRAAGRAAIGLFLASFACTGLLAPAAEIHLESFAADSAGWTNSGALTVGATNGFLLGRFAAQTIPAPGTGAFVATNGSSGGAFVGDYPAAGIQLIGFAFMAQDVLPSSAILRWHGPTSSYFRSFAASILQTGVWYRLAFPMESRAAGRWQGGGEELFALDRADVKSVEIQVSRSGTTAQRYGVDDVFVDVLPTGSIGPAASDVHLFWTALQAGTVYAVETAAQPGGPWTETARLAATDRVQEWSDPDASAASNRLYRLRFAECQ